MNLENKTELLDGKIKVWDDVLFVADFNYVSLAVSKLDYKLGEKDDYDTPPIGMIAELNTEHAIYKMFTPMFDQIEELNGLYCDRAYVNLFSKNEDAFFHDDRCMQTILFYCNPYWELNDGGETKFVELNDKSLPLMIAVPPIPNRLVMFPGDLGHTATSLRHEKRFTLAFKMEKK
jgi:hypothetical protein